MKHEELLKEIDEMIAKNRCYRIGCLTEKDPKNHLTNLNNLLGKIKTVLKNADNEYERGCEDAWALARKICAFSSEDSYTYEELNNIFNNVCPENIMNHNTAKEALAKVEAYEKKKKEEEAEKPVIGDVVECVYKYDTSKIFKGIVRNIDDNHIYILTKECVHIKCFLKSEFDIKKTGKRFDIQGMLDEIKTED